MIDGFAPVPDLTPEVLAMTVDAAQRELARLHAARIEVMAQGVDAIAGIREATHAQLAALNELVVQFEVRLGGELNQNTQ